MWSSRSAPTHATTTATTSTLATATAVAFERATSADSRLYFWCMADSLIKPWIAEMVGKGLLPAYADLDIGTPDDQITTIVDVSAVGAIRRAGIAEHRTQLAPFDGLSDALYERILKHDYLVRVVPAWDGGPVESSLFGV